MSKISEKLKTFGISNLALKNSTSVYVLIFIILIAGVTAYTSMPKESFPEIKQPTIYINTAYPGNSPVDIENLVSRPIEKEINSVNGIKKLKSTSIQDFSVIIVEFNVDVPVEEALADVKDAVDKAKNELPTDLPADPSVMELDFSEMPVMNVNLYGNISYEDLKENAEFLEDKIEDLPEISGVDIAGLQEKEVKVMVDLPALEALQLSLNDVIRSIQGENATISGGDIKMIDGEDISRRNIRIDGEFKNYKNIENIVVKAENQKVVYLRDFAEIKFSEVEPTSFARLEGKPVLTLDVKKKSGANLLIAADKIQEILVAAKKDKLPKELNTVVTNDQSKFTRNMVANLESSIYMGIILVVLVLLFFLGLRSALFVGIAIPLSMLLGFTILNMGGNTLNMMVLFSLILALGMLVDNGIVVVENIYRYMNEGYSKKDAARLGVGEVAVPIITSTATTVAAFVPLLFWKSLIGEFMKFLPITLIIVLVASLFVGLVVNPVITKAFMKTQDEELNKKSKNFWRNTIIVFVMGIILLALFKSALGGLLIAVALFLILNKFVLTPASERFTKNTLPKFENAYSRFLRFSLNHRIIFVLFTFALMIFSMVGFFGSSPKVLFFPDNQPRMVMAYIETPLGTDIETTNEITKELEKKIDNAIKPNRIIVEALMAQVGERTADPNEGPQSGSSPHKSKITVSFLEYEKRQGLTDVSTSQILEDIRKAVKNYPRAQITVAKDASGPPTGKPINVEVSGENYLELITYTEKLKKIMEDANLPGVDKLKTDLETGKPELLFNVNRDAAGRFGVSTQQLAMAIRDALFGREASKYKEGEDDYKIQVRLQDRYRYNLSALENMKVTFRNNMGKLLQVPISSVATLEFSSSYGSVKRQDMEKVISIFSNVQEGANANEIVGKYKEILAAKAPTKDGVSWKFAGEQEEQAESSSFLGTAMLMALFIVFLIIVTQFNSILHPLIIMISILFSTIGVFLGLWIFNMPFVILMCGIGIISLAGVVVNNAIVLIDYINQLKTRKKDELGLDEDSVLGKKEVTELIIKGGATRLRPVLLTAITTILGLIPLAIGLNFDFAGLFTKLNPNVYWGGDNAEFWGPMSWTIIFGLTFATFLTLVLVPVMYSLMEQLTRKIKGAS
jgi:multidrug efflux pump subunit AcrB